MNPAYGALPLLFQCHADKNFCVVSNLASAQARAKLK